MTVDEQLDQEVSMEDINHPVDDETSQGHDSDRDLESPVHKSSQLRDHMLQALEPSLMKQHQSLLF